MVIPIKKLIFVYNVNSNPFALVGATVSKLVSPDTYTCNLCKLTYPVISMDKEWNKFLETLPLEKEFLHKDEFKSKFPQLNDTKLPVIFIKEGEEIKVLITSDEINQQKNISQLKELIMGRLVV